MPPENINILSQEQDTPKIVIPLPDSIDIKTPLYQDTTDTFSVLRNFDTLKVIVQQDSSRLSADSGSTLIQKKLQDSIFPVTEQNKIQTKQIEPGNLVSQLKIDSLKKSKIFTDLFPYYFEKITVDTFSPQNFLFNIPRISLQKKQQPTSLFISDPTSNTEFSDKSYKKYISQIDDQKEFFKGVNIKPANDWTIGVVLFSLILLAWIKLFYNKYLSQIFFSIYNYQISFKLFQARNILLQRVSFWLYLIYILNGGLFIYQVFQYYNIHPLELQGFFSFLIYSSFFLLLYLAKYTVCNLVVFVFFVQRQFAQYLHNAFLFNKNLGLLLFPVIIGIPYMPEIFTKPLIIIGIGLFILIFFLRIIRGIRIIIKKDVLIFYLILYLCTFEFLPLFLFYKFFLSFL